MALAAGDRLGPYEILTPLGAGGMGEVCKARDTRVGREVAIKVSKAEFSERFTREAHLIAALNHPHICTLYDIGPNYLVMEFIDGVPLKGPLPQAEALRFAGQIADALDHAHQRGITHRDLKPSNILVTQQGIKLLDFGLVNMSAGPNDTTLTRLAGPRSDIYAFGCVLYEMLMGRRVQEGRRRLDPPALERVLAKCLQPDPAQRYQSAAELKQALAVAQKGHSFKREYVFVVIAVVMLILGLGLLMMEFPSNQRLTDKDVLVLADFSNTTGDAIFDGTLRVALAIQLEQSPFLKIMDDEQVQQDLKLMGRPADSRITNAIAHDICVREGQKAMIGGSIADLGKVFAVTVQAVNCHNGATLAREQVQAESREQVLNAISKASTGIRTKLGESLSSIQKLDRPLEQVTTESLPAFQAFSLGMGRRRQGEELSAAPFFERAIELDPNFATAYVLLYFVYINVGDDSRATEYLTKAFALADRVNEYEHLRIEALYYRGVTGDLNKAVDTNQLIVRTYPRDYATHNHLGNIYAMLGEFEQALREHQIAAAGDPFYISAAVTAHARLDRFSEAKKAAKVSNVPAIHRRLLQIAFIQGDAAAAAKEIQWFAGKPEEHLGLTEQFQNSLVHGEFKRAATLAQEGARLAEQHNLQGAAEQLRAQVAGMGEFRGGCSAAQKIGAVAALLCSDAEGPLAAAENQAKLRPNDTLLTGVRFPVARATFAIQQNQPAKAIEALQSAAPYERAYSQVRYLRGLAYLRLGKGPEAAAEFQKILDHKGANWGVVYPISYLGAGRAWASAGDSAKAKKAYEDFLTLWKDADADLPVLTQAKKEYAALR